MPTTTRRLLVVSALGREYGWGGSENYWFEAVQDLAGVGWAIDVLLERSPATEQRAEELGAQGVNVVWNERPPVRDVERLISAVSRRLGGQTRDRDRMWWVEALSRLKPDLIWFSLPSIGHVPTVALPACLAAEGYLPYWIIVQHAYEHGFPPDDLAVSTSRGVLLAARRVIFIAEANRRSVERSIATRLPNAWMSVNALSGEFFAAAADLFERTPPGRSEAPTFLNLARFDPGFKGQHLLLELLSQDPWINRDWRLLLAGGGRLAQTLRELILYYEFDDGRVELVDYSNDVLPVIERADVALMPSLSEGTPFAAIEAMAAGRPLVATPVGGLPEIVRDGETGWIADASDTSHLGEALERAWQMRASWADMGRAAAAYVCEHHAQERVFADLRRLLEDDSGKRPA